jgi:membrane-associated protein
MPFARTFSPVVAGIAQLKFSRFAAYNVVGAICWICSMTLLGYFLGRSFPGIRDHIEIVIAVIIFVSVLPIAIKYLQHRFGRAKADGGGGSAAATDDAPQA